MPRHAKNNTNGSVFTYAERQMARDQNGTARQRLGRDSMKECILTNLLSQKKDIKRQTVLLERMRAEAEKEMALARVAARERVLKEFETSQSALGGGPSSNASKTAATTAAGGSTVGSKRKFEFDEDELEKRTAEATEEALRKTTQEMADARKAKLPNFWLASRTGVYA
ncbi:hypothetical protein OIV83_005467 [Microbotryomycetes sp. JL201]|nr:hypothetical protein OIV83_005467 [Microbotryomycetes sp. JL201]